MKEINKSNNNSIVAKAGLWYTFCNFLFKGMAFLTTPIFARMMSKNELGTFSNFSSWVTILTVVTSIDFAQSIIRSKLDVEDDIDSYIWSILSLSSIWTICLYVVVCSFQNYFASLFQIDMKYIHVMFAYLIFSPAYTMLITKQRAFYKYKMFVLLTAVMLGSGTLFSVLMVFLLNNKVDGRIYGFYVPNIIFSAIIFIYIIVKGKKISISYWKYAITICVPLVPHVLSLYLLSSSDKIIITKICGAEYTAVYSIAYSAYHIVTILFDSMNKAWAPWLLESLHKEKYEDIRKVSRIYISVFVVIIIGALLVVPEIIMFLGGAKYTGAIPCLPPLIFSCMVQFVYTMYVNIEFYRKKTVGVSIATMIAMVTNIVLNIILIPLNVENGFIIAAYTTMAGYILLFILHFGIVKSMRMSFVYDTKFILAILCGVGIVASFVLALYNNTILRYIILAVYIVVILAVAYINRKKIKSILK